MTIGFSNQEVMELLDDQELFQSDVREESFIRAGSRKSGRRETGDSRDISFEEFCCKPGVVDRGEVRPRVFFVLFSRWENQHDVCFR